MPGRKGKRKIPDDVAEPDDKLDDKLDEPVLDDTKDTSKFLKNAYSFTPEQENQMVEFFSENSEFYNKYSPKNADWDYRERQWKELVRMVSPD